MESFSRVEELLKQHNISVSKMEQILGMSNCTISRWENADPKLSNLILLSKYFGISLDYIAGLTDEQKSFHSLTDLSCVDESLLRYMNEMGFTDDDKKLVRNFMEMIVEIKQRTKQ